MEICTFLSLLPAPIVAIALYLLLRYKYPKGKFALVYKTFLLGVAGIIPVFLMDKIIMALHLDHLHSLNRTLFYAFVLTGGVIEFWKFVVLKLFVYQSKLVVRTIDVIIYSLFIAAGFTFSYTVYDVFYASSFIDHCLFAFTIGPVFVLISVIMGYFTGIAIRRQHPLIDLVTGLFLAVIFQGIYRFCLLTSDTLLLYMTMGGMIVIGLTLLVISLREPSNSN